MTGSLLMLARAFGRLDQLDLRGLFQVDRVAFVGIEVDFEFDFLAGPDDDFLKNGRAVAAFNAEVHFVSILNAVVGAVGRSHVDVPHGADDALAEIDDSLGTDKDATRCAFDIAANADGQVDAEANPVGEGEFDLGLAPTRAEHADVGDHATTGAEDGDGFLGGVETVLIKPLRGGQIVLPEQGFDMFLREVAVPGGDVDKERVWFVAGRRFFRAVDHAQTGPQDFPDNVFDRFACDVGGRLGHGR